MHRHPSEQHIVPAMFGRRHIAIAPVNGSQVDAGAHRMLGMPVTDMSAPWVDNTMVFQSMRCRTCFRIIDPAITGSATICPPEEWCTCEHPVHIPRE